MKTITHCPRCETRLSLHHQGENASVDNYAFYCQSCPKIELYKGFSQEWFTLYVSRSSAKVVAWALTTHGWVLYTDFKTTSIYNGHEAQYYPPNPPEELYLRSHEEIVLWIKTFLIFR